MARKVQVLKDLIPSKAIKRLNKRKKMKIMDIISQVYPKTWIKDIDVQ